MTEQQMVEDGWRRCAVGQRTTEHCGMAEEARAQERTRIRALVQAECDRLGRQCVPTRVPFEEGRIAALHHVLTMISLEGASHE